MDSTIKPVTPVTFAQFYKQVFLPEHKRPITIVLHTFGTFAGLAWLIAMPYIGWPFLVLLFPVIHAAPGLIGHRLFERNLAVGDLRATRKDYSPLWFIAANHKMAWELLTRGALKR